MLGSRVSASSPSLHLQLPAVYGRKGVNYHLNSYYSHSKCCWFYGDAEEHASSSFSTLPLFVSHPRRAKFRSFSNECNALEYKHKYLGETILEHVKTKHKFSNVALVLKNYPILSVVVSG